MIKVSIIIPTYNSAKYLEKCLNSVFNQTEKDIEVILINDGSTDNSRDIIKKFKDKRLIYIEKENEGIGKTRNLGIKKAQGEYLAFLDSDDYLEKDFVSKMYNKAIKDNCDLVICDYYQVTNKKNIIKFPSFTDTNLSKDPKVINKINLGPCNKLYSRKLFNNPNNRFEENLKYEDAPFVVKMMIEATKIGKVDECLTNYVIHEKSETTIRDNRIFDILKITKIIINDLNSINFNQDELTNLIVLIVTDYTIQQRYIKDKPLRNKFIDEAFELLDNQNKKWRKCSYLKRFPFLKRKIKKSKLLTKLYCSWYSKKHN